MRSMKPTVLIAVSTLSASHGESRRAFIEAFPSGVTPKSYRG
jgi:hypothetical protein